MDVWGDRWGGAWGVSWRQGAAPPVEEPAPTGGHMAAQLRQIDIDQDDEEVFAIASAYLRMAA